MTVKLQTSGTCQSFSLLWCSDTQCSCSCFPEEYRAILGKLGQFMDQRQHLPELPQLHHRLQRVSECQALHGKALVFHFGSCFLLWRTGIAQQPLPTQSCLGRGAGPGTETAQMAFGLCMTLCLRLGTAKIHHYREKTLPSVSQKHWTSLSRLLKGSDLEEAF